MRLDMANPPRHFLGGHIGKWQGRQRPSSMEFSSRRPASPASTWAWTLRNPTPLYSQGVTSEGQLQQSPALMTKHRLQASRNVQSHAPLGVAKARPVGADAAAETRPSSVMSIATFNSQARSQSPDSNASLPLSSDSRNPAYDELRPRETASPSQFSLLGYGPQPAVTAKALDAIQSFRERPAGLSRTPAGQRLGLNSNMPPQHRAQRPASALGLSSTTARTVATESRFVNLSPNYLLDLERHRANPGCTKHVPGRRFVDFVSLSQGALLADTLRDRAQEGARPFFSATSRAIPPPAEPYKLRKAYGGGGTCYTEFNRSCLTGTIVSR